MSGDTVITPEALERSNFTKITASQMYDIAADWNEVFIFIFPSPDAADQVNGDGQLLEVDDISRNCDTAYCNKRTIPITRNTTFYVR